MQQESSAPSVWQALSQELSGAVERAGRAVVALNARRRIPSSGVVWRPGTIVTANHTLEHEVLRSMAGLIAEITATLPDGRTTPVSLIGRDPSTDLAVLRLEGVDLAAAEAGDLSSVRVGQVVLAVARTSEGGDRATLATIGVLGAAWRPRAGGLLDRAVRLDRNLHPNFSGGPVVDQQGRVLGIATSALSRYSAVVIPASTVSRVIDELLTRGRIARGYLGLGMYPLQLPANLRTSLNLPGESGIMVVAVETESPAEKAGVMIGDVVVALDGSSVRDTDDVQFLLGGERVGKPLSATIVRAGSLKELTIVVGERPSVQP
jgi:S1-C subfamily serine protease